MKTENNTVVEFKQRLEDLISQYKKNQKEKNQNNLLTHTPEVCMNKESQYG